MEFVDFELLSSTSKFMVIAGVFCVLAGVACVAFAMMRRMVNPYISSAPIFVGVGALVFGLVMSMWGMMNPMGKTEERIVQQAEDAALEQRMRWDNAKKDGYSFYYNGAEVDPETVSYTQYNVVYNDENKSVYLAQPTPAPQSDSHTTTFFPIFIPYD